MHKFLSLFNNNKKEELNKQEVFVVIVLSYFGDSLVGNSLFQNIKRIYPNSKTVCIINKQFYEVAKYQKDVDEVIIFDKNKEHKGFFGLIKFIKDFPYKKIKYVFKMCKKERADIIAFLLHPKKIINYNNDLSIPTHKRYSNLLKEVTNEEILDLPIVYNAETTIPDKFQDIIKADKKYIALCTTSSNFIKDMPVDTAVELINKLKDDKYNIIFVGVGESAQNYALALEKNNCTITNLVNKTTIYELACILRNCACLISVDTGTMHLGYANGIPTVCCFYSKDNIIGWMPDKKLYPYTILPTDNSPKCIYESCKEVINGYYD